ncbi:hypothetical protein Tco_1409432 [Tanacetum coccineum]
MDKRSPARTSSWKSIQASANKMTTYRAMQRRASARLKNTSLGNSLTSPLARTKGVMLRKKVLILRKHLLLVARLDAVGGRFYVELSRWVVDTDHPRDSVRLRKSSIWIETSSKSMAKYTLEILKKHGMEKGQSIGTPMATKPKLDADLSGEPVDQTDYRSKIGSLMYLTSSRPDIVQAVCYCARYQARPTEKHLKEVKRIFRYLRGTIHMGLWYPKGSGFELTAFSDADHAGCLDTRKSTSGGIQFLGDKLVSWMSKKQDCTAMSSAEAEYVALSASCAQVMWMRTQLQDYGFNYNKIPLYCDSQSAIAISCNPVQHSRTKHIHTRYHFIKEQVENGIIELYFVRTEYQLADMFTKALPEDRFQYLVRQIGMRCLTPAELEVQIHAKLSRFSLMATTDAVILDPTLEDLAIRTPSSKILAKAEASTTRPSLFVGDTDDESDGDDDACVKIPLVTPSSFCCCDPFLREPRFLGDVSGDAIHVDFFPFSVGLYYATYPQDGITGNCEFTREEWDAPYRPTFGVLTKEVFKDPVVCKTMVDQFPTRLVKCSELKRCLRIN